MDNVAVLDRVGKLSVHQTRVSSQDAMPVRSCMFIHSHDRKTAVYLILLILSVELHLAHFPLILAFFYRNLIWFLFTSFCPSRDERTGTASSELSRPLVTATLFQLQGHHKFSRIDIVPLLLAVQLSPYFVFMNMRQVSTDWSGHQLSADAL